MTLYAPIAALELEIERLVTVPRSRTVASDFERWTTLVRLEGGGEVGVGEDVCYDAPDQHRFREHAATLELAGRWTLEGFSARLEELDLFGTPPAQEAYRDYRRWAFESAALDLALRQAGRSLAGILGREPQPVRFVVSTALGTPPQTRRLERLRAHDPSIGFKLDATSAWDERLLARLTELGGVEVVDFKGAYRGTPVDQPVDPELYARVLAALPEAWIEDPHDDPRVDDLLAPHRERVAWDAPIHSTADIAALPYRPGAINVKPSRFGSWKRLLAAYEYCAAEGLVTYGGGQFELDVGRRQIQALAALFHAEAPNDVAPVHYHDDPPPADAPRSPLPPPADAPGFCGP